MNQKGAKGHRRNEKAVNFLNTEPYTLRSEREERGEESQKEKER